MSETIMYDIYDAYCNWYGANNNFAKAFNYAYRHNYVVVNRNTGEVAWTLLTDPSLPIFRKLKGVG